MKTITNQFIYLSLVAIILFIAIFLRFNRLSEVGLAFEEPIHIYAAKGIIENGDPILPSSKQYRRSLLFTKTVALSFKLFGETKFSARLPSAIFSMLSVIVIYMFGKEFFDKKVAILAALLMAFAPFEIVWARMCRMYSMYQFFYLFSVFSFYKGFESNFTIEPYDFSIKVLRKNRILSFLLALGINWKWIFLSILSVLVTLHLQPLGLSIGLSITTYLLIMLFVTILNSDAKLIWKTKYFLSLSVIAVAALIILLNHGNLIAAIGFSPPWAQNQSVSITRYLKFLQYKEIYPITIFFVLSSIQLIIRFNRAGIFFCIIIIIPLVFHSFFAHVQQFRYIYDIFPVILLISSYGITNFYFDEQRALNNITNNSTNRRFVKLLFPIAMLFVFCILFYPSINIAINLPKLQPKDYGGSYHVRWEEGCRYVNNHFKPGETLIASIPLAAEFSGCKSIDYNLNNGEIDQFKTVEGSRFKLPPFSKTRAIVDYKDFITVLAENPKGWLLLDNQRFNSNVTIPIKIRNLIKNNFNNVFTSYDKTLLVYYWNEDLILNSHISHLFTEK